MASDFDVQADAGSDLIRVAAAGPDVVSVLARAEGIISFPRSFRSACRSESATVDLPTSPDFDSYVVRTLALGEPQTAAEGRARVFPARRREQVVSGSVPLGPVWDAALTLAAQSPRHPACEGYCREWQQRCQASADPDQFTVTCVALGSLEPGCGDKLDRYMRCEQATLSCEDVSVVSYSEANFDTDQSVTQSACGEEEQAYAGCVDADMP
jgi:hypothetical protein